jgi:hypothetical protein
MKVYAYVNFLLTSIPHLEQIPRRKTQKKQVQVTQRTITNIIIITFKYSDSFEANTHKIKLTGNKPKIHTYFIEYPWE